MHSFLKSVFWKKSSDLSPVSLQTGLPSLPHVQADDKELYQPSLLIQHRGRGSFFMLTILKDSEVVCPAHFPALLESLPRWSHILRTYVYPLLNFMC